jgi:hypothetical protein
VRLVHRCLSQGRDWDGVEICGPAEDVTRYTEVFLKNMTQHGLRGEGLGGSVSVRCGGGNVLVRFCRVRASFIRVRGAFGWQGETVIPQAGKELCLIERIEVERSEVGRDDGLTRLCLQSWLRDG